MRRMPRGLLAVADRHRIVRGVGVWGRRRRRAAAATTRRSRSSRGGRAPGEEEGLNAMIEDFKQNNPGIEFVNAAVAGGSGTQATPGAQPPGCRATTRRTPTSVHAGQGAGQRHRRRQGRGPDLPLRRARAGRTSSPRACVDADHGRRQDLLGAGQHPPVQPALVQPRRRSKKAGIAAPPKTWDEFLDPGRDARRPRTSPPISVGPTWTQHAPARERAARRAGHEQVQRACGTARPTGSRAEVIAALDIFKKVWRTRTSKSAAADWQPALDKVHRRHAAYNVMGDWADALPQGAARS